MRKYAKSTGPRRRLTSRNSQFGNMLVLSATYKSRLSFMIRRDEIVGLLERTIRFINSHRPTSTALGKDASILEGILSNIDEPLPDLVTLSFSSTL